MKKTFLSAALAFVAAASALHADPVNWDDYARSFEITFPGYTSTATLTDFPVLIRLSAARNAFDYSKCPNGASLRFSDEDGNLLPCEIDTWDPEGESLVWVKVTALNADTIITAHYGNANPVEMDSTQVWSNGYLGVWHLNEVASPLEDSTGGGKNWTRSADHEAMVNLGGAGVLGNAVAFDKVTEGDNAHKGSLSFTDNSKQKPCGRYRKPQHPPCRTD